MRELLVRAAMNTRYIEIKGRIQIKGRKTMEYEEIYSTMKEIIGYIYNQKLYIKWHELLSQILDKYILYLRKTLLYDIEFYIIDLLYIRNLFQNYLYFTINTYDGFDKIKKKFTKIDQILFKLQQKLLIYTPKPQHIVNISGLEVMC